MSQKFPFQRRLSVSFARGPNVPKCGALRGANATVSSTKPQGHTRMHHTSPPSHSFVTQGRTVANNIKAKPAITTQTREKFLKFRRLRPAWSNDRVKKFSQNIWTIFFSRSFGLIVAGTHARTHARRRKRKRKGFRFLGKFCPPTHGSSLSRRKLRTAKRRS